MKISILSVIALAFMATGFVGCGMGADGNDQMKAQQERDAKALEERFQTVRGTYEGNLVNPASGLGPLRAKMILYVVNVRESANPDGSVRIRPALYGRFQLVDEASTTDYLTLSGDYNELGGLNLTSVSGQGTGSSSTPDTRTGASGSEAFSLRGSIYDGKANIELTRSSGVWGQFVGTRTTFDASAPTASDFETYRAKLLRILTPIEGVYSAVLQGGAERIRVSITMTISEDSVTHLPTLSGQFRRLDMPPGSGVGDRTLAIVYDSTTGLMTLVGTDGGNPTVPGSNYFSGRGTWRAGTLSVLLRDKLGQLGQLEAVRQPL